MSEQSIDELIDKIKNKELEACMFGMGTFSKTGKYILDYLGIQCVFYLDNDKKKWGTFPLDDGIMCLSPDEALTSRKNVVVFIFAFRNYTHEIINQLERYNIAGIICESDILQNNNLIRKIITSEFKASKYSSVQNCWDISPKKYRRVANRSNKKIAIYTCVTGDYDKEVYEPYEYKSNCDYFYISDKKPKELFGYQWINVHDYLPKNIELDNHRINRFFKINGNYFFEEYPYSIYVDGNIQIREDFTNYMVDTQSGYGMYSHNDTPSLYAEAIKAYSLGHDSKDTVVRQMMKYYEEGFPDKFGLFENGVILRNSRNKVGQQISQTWWEEVYSNSKRDQLSFCYALWKNGCATSDVLNMGNDIYNDSKVKVLYFHRRKNGKI